MTDSSAAYPQSWYRAMPVGAVPMHDFSRLADALPLLTAGSCVGCLDCVTQCPDNALIATVSPREIVETALGSLAPTEQVEANGWVAITRKYHDKPLERGVPGGLFVLSLDPTRCKGCGECVVACGAHAALTLVPVDNARRQVAAGCALRARLPATDPRYIDGRLLPDLMLRDTTALYRGGAPSCPGCGESTAIRMMVTATGTAYGADHMGVVAATGCNTVFGSSFPHNPYGVPWTSSLFENAPAVAMGVRTRWDHHDRSGDRLWVIAGDGAAYDIGLQALSRLLASGQDIKVMVLDTQGYANTGGQVSTASFQAQDAKLASVGPANPGKREARKDLALLAIMHPDVFVAQTTTAHVVHFYRSIIAANEFRGPAVVIVYAPCPPEHGIPDDAAVSHSELAVTSRAFPLLVHDPRAGESLRERLSLRGNPAIHSDWVTDRSGATVDFISFARAEGRFARHFNALGEPSDALRASNAERLRHWHRLKELAGIATSDS